MFQLHATTGCILPEEVLERAKHHHRLLRVGMFKLIVYSSLLATGYELPPVKIHMRHQVLFPGMSHGRLECQHQHALPSHTPCQLVSGKGLAKAHLAVPQEVRYTPGFRLVAVKIVCRLVNSPFLLRAHAEGLVAVPCHVYPFPDGNDGRPDLLGRTAIPLAFNVPAPHLDQHPVNIMVHKHRTVLTHGTLFHQYAVRRFARPHDVILLAHTFLHANSSISHLQDALQLWVILILIRINHRSRLRLPWEIILCCCHNLIVFVMALSVQVRLELECLGDKLQ